MIYRVQIVTTAEPVSPTDDRFMGMTVWKYESNDLYKYTVWMFTSIEPAKKLKTEMREKGFESAFVVAFLNGERISIEKAIKMIEN